MTTYDKLKRHLERHMYKRGQFKGEAPLDGSKRQRNHVRVREGFQCMIVRMYSTNILTAHADGRVTLHTDGWDTSSTTKMRMNEALRFVPFWCGIYSTKVMGLSQTVIRVQQARYKYYDGITFNADGTLASEARPFQMLRIDRAETKEFAQELVDSGFKAVFALLYASTEYCGNNVPLRLRETLADANYAHRWPEVISAYKYRRVYNYKEGQYEHLELGTDRECWQAIMKDVKKGMYVKLDSTTTTI